MPRKEQLGPEDREQPRNGRRGCLAHVLGVLLLLLLIGAGLFSAVMVQRAVLTPYESRIYPNVYVLEENLGGFTVEEAAVHLRQVFARHDAGDLILSDGEQSWRIPWSEAGMRLDPDATARRAFAACRDQGWQVLLSMWFETRAQESNHHVSPVFSIDGAATRRALEALAPELHEAPTNAKLWLDHDQVMVAPSQAGRALDVDATAEKIVDTVTHLGPDYPFAPTYKTLRPSIADVEAVRAKAQNSLIREISITARGEHEGEIFAWEWTLGRETIADWLRVEETEELPGFAIGVDEAAVKASVAQLAAQPEADDWGFPHERVIAEVLRAYEAGGGSVAVELTPPPRIYVVQSGDRLTTIANRFGMPPGLIAELNQGIDLDQLYVGQQLVIPPQDVLTPHEPVRGKQIVISVAEQRLRAYEDGQLLYDWPCSTGKEDSPTYRGSFQVLSKEETAYASQWDLEMPHFIGVYRAGGDAINGIHALPFLSSGQRLWAGNLGSRASFGCIILGIEEAETLYNWAELGVPVTIE